MPRSIHKLIGELETGIYVNKWIFYNLYKGLMLTCPTLNYTKLVDLGGLFCLEKLNMKSIFYFPQRGYCLRISFISRTNIQIFLIEKSESIIPG